MNFFQTLLVTLVILALAGLAMAIGVLFKRKPIRHCGGASLSMNGDKIDCPACGNASQCRKKKQLAEKA